jgi:AraC-like DNA-binding protein
MVRADDWDLKRFVRIQYKVSETHPIDVGKKVHPGASAVSFDMHYALEVGILTGGKMARVYQGHKRTLEPGQIWFCGAWEPHGWQVLDGPCRAVVVTVFPPMLANAAFPEAASFDWMAPFVLAPAARPQVPRAMQREFLRLAQELAKTLDVAPPRRTLLQRMLLYQILLELPEVHDAASPAALPDDSYGRINKAVELVFKSHQFLTATEAAHACGLGRKAFSALFEKVMGVSFAKFALRHRLQGAASRLLESTEPVKAIASDWGFTDASHLYTAFHAAYGCSPAQYRKGQKYKSHDTIVHGASLGTQRRAR